MSNKTSFLVSAGALGLLAVGPAVVQADTPTSNSLGDVVTVLCQTLQVCAPSNPTPDDDGVIMSRD
jgi:hypothetical protein